MSTSKRKSALGNNTFDALDLMVPPASVPPPPMAAPPVAVPAAAAVPKEAVTVVEKTQETAREEAVVTPAAPRRVLREKAKPVEAAAPKGRSKVTFTLSTELLEQCKNAVDHLSGPPVRLTLVALVENALRKELSHLRNKHHEGQEFPTREGPLRPGRPLR